MKSFRFLLLGVGMWLAVGSSARAEGLDDLRAREEKVKAIVQRVMPCVVAVTSADEDKPGSGSGVIISKDGLILTAAHVTQATGNNLTIIFPDGRRVKGTSLGANRTTDAGMARITEPGDWPFVEMGSSDLLKLGDWVVAMGHPGGYSFERRPPVRLGRVWRRDLDGALFTSCPLIGGDSGGPLFDLEGRVIGIHSSIHGSVEMNRHVAIDTLRFDWEKLEKDQTWGKVSFNSSNDSRPITGALFDRESRDGVVVKQVFEDLPAFKAGLKSGDVVKKFDGEEVANFHALQRLLGRRKPGDLVPLAVQRGDGLVDLQLELGRRFLPRRDGQGNLPSDDPEAGPNVPFVPEAPGPLPWLGAAVELSADGPRLGPLSPEGPAAKAGLKPGDVLLKINGTAVKDATEVSDVLLALPPEATTTFELQREGQPLTLEVKLGKK
jgi:serine protease Do